MPIADIIIGQAYHLRFDPKLWKAMQPYPPLGPLYALSYLRSRGLSVAFADSMLSTTTNDWTRALERTQARFAVLYEDNFNYLTKMCLLRMREAAFEMIRSAKNAGCTVIVSGSDASDNSPLYLREGADYVIVGEGEIALGELLESLVHRSKLEPDEVAGVRSRRTAESEVAPRIPIRNLDDMPFPAWEAVDLERYRQIWLRRHGYFSLSMVTTRGCPYHCNWCAKPIWGQRYNSRSPENVVEEMEWLARSARPDHIWFTDDIFGLKKGWIEQFARLLEGKGLRIPFKCLMRADLVNEAVAEALGRAGCTMVWIGAESGSQKVLDAMEKGTTVSDNDRATARLRRQGIAVGYFLQFGYPGEEWSDIKQTIRMIRNNRPDDIGVSISYPLPGTKFYARVRSEMDGKENWIDSDDLAPLFRGRYRRSFYRILHRAVHREFRARRAFGNLVRMRRFSPKPLIGSALIPLDQARLLYYRGLNKA